MNDSQETNAAPPTADTALEPPARRFTPPRRWRRWLAEIGVVVIGVLLALGAQQLIETLNWNQKVRVLESAIRAELSNDLGLANELILLHPCVTEYLDTLQTAVLAGDDDTIRQLANIGPPLFGRAWPRVTAYSRAFLRIEVQREFMQMMEDLYPVALSGGFGLPHDVGVTNGQLVAIQRLRGLETRRQLIANSLLDEDGPAVSVAPSDKYLAEDEAYVLACAANLKTIRAAASAASPPAPEER